MGFFWCGLGFGGLIYSHVKLFWRGIEKNIAQSYNSETFIMFNLDVYCKYKTDILKRQKYLLSYILFDIKEKRQTTQMINILASAKMNIVSIALKTYDI